MRVDPPDRNRRHEPAKNRNAAGSDLPVRNVVREGAGYKGKRASLWPDSLHEGCLIGSAVAQEIDGAERKRAVLETCPLGSQGQPALLPSGAEVRKRLGRTVKHLHRILPEAEVWIRRHHAEAFWVFYQRRYIIRNHTETLSSKRRGGRRLSRPFRAHEHNTPILNRDGACMKACHASQPQQKAEHRSQQIRSGVFKS